MSNIDGVAWDSPRCEQLQMSDYVTRRMAENEKGTKSDTEGL